jgi:hypothetical protein
MPPTVKSPIAFSDGLADPVEVVVFVGRFA